MRKFVLILFVLLLGCEYIEITPTPTFEERLIGSWQVCVLDSTGAVRTDMTYYHQKWITRKDIHFYTDNEGSILTTATGNGIPFVSSSARHFAWDLQDSVLTIFEEDTTWISEEPYDVSFRGDTMYWEQEPNRLFLKR